MGRELSLTQVAVRCAEDDLTANYAPWAQTNAFLLLDNEHMIRLVWKLGPSLYTFP